MSKSNIKVLQQNFIPDFPLDTDFSEYSRIVMKDFKNLKNYFPLLNVTSLPTIKPKEIFITGNLIPWNLLEKCVTLKDIERNSLYILGTYPSNYPDEDIYVEDFYEKINWGNIPYKHRHKRIHPKTNRIILCTHHPNGEVNAFKERERTVAILSSAWKLYVQYKKYLKVNKWTLKDLKHGFEGASQLKKMGKYYKK